MRTVRELLSEWGLHVLVAALIVSYCLAESKLKGVPGISPLVHELLFVLFALAVARTLDIVFSRHIEDWRYRWVLIVAVLAVTAILNLIDPSAARAQ